MSEPNLMAIHSIVFGQAIKQMLVRSRWEHGYNSRKEGRKGGKIKGKKHHPRKEIKINDTQK